MSMDRSDAPGLAVTEEALRIIDRPGTVKTAMRSDHKWSSTIRTHGNRAPLQDFFEFLPVTR